ncbi:MAG: hypothetical protein JSR28_13620 [Proteobacteria bacterium]|nr:hypothetical protein [Pseudomonadota bacterium]
MESTTNIANPEYRPVLEGELASPDRVSVQFDIKPDGGTLNFIMHDTTDWPPGSDGRALVKDSEGNTCLAVERGQDRIFTFSLSPNWRWTFDLKANGPGEPMTFKKGDAPLYKVTVVSDTQIEIYAKARPHMPTGTALDLFNLHVLMMQDSGTPISLRIDPGTRNPPPYP